MLVWPPVILYIFILLNCGLGYTPVSSKLCWLVKAHGGLIAPVANNNGGEAAACLPQGEQGDEDQAGQGVGGDGAGSVQ